MKYFQNNKYYYIMKDYKERKIKSMNVKTEIENLMDDLIRNIDSLDAEDINEFYAFIRYIADIAVDKQDTDILTKCQTVTRRFGKENGDLQCYWQIMEKSFPFKECFGDVEAQNLIASIFETNEYEMPIKILIKYAKKNNNFGIIDKCDKAIRAKDANTNNVEVKAYFESKVAQLIRDEIKPKGFPFKYASDVKWRSFDKYAKNWKGRW